MWACTQMTTMILPFQGTTRKSRRELELARYFAQAKAAGCPQDQVRNFLRAGYAAQPKQLTFHALARQADNPALFTGATPQIAQGGARGGAKSHAAICQVVHDDCVRYPGLMWLYLRSVGKSARESFEDMLSKAIPQALPFYKMSRSRLELPNGSLLVLGGFRIDSDIDEYMGIEYDGILIDDGQLIGGERHKKILGSLRSSKPGWRPRLYITFNPGGVGHAYIVKTFVEPWERRGETDTRFVFSLPEDNVFLNPEYICYLEGLTGWLYRAWRKGDFHIAAGQFFTTFQREVHVVEGEVTSPLPAHWPVWMSMDYGFAHWTVVYLHAEGPDGVVYTVDEHAERRWLPERHVAAVRAMLERHGVAMEAVEAFVAGPGVFSRDRDGRCVAEDWAERGFILTPANADRVNGAAEVLRRLGDVSAGISPTWFIHRRCERLLECLPALEHDPHRPEDVLKVNTDEDGEGGDDFYDAARYGLMWRAPRGNEVEAGPDPLAGWRG